MASDRDDRWGGDADSGRGDRMDNSPEEILRRAREKVATPAMLMIVAGVIMLLLSLVSVGFIASGYDPGVAMLEKIYDMQPPGKGKDDLRKQIDESKNQDKTTQYIMNAVFGVIGLTFNVMILLGGLRMKALKSHTLAMLGSICAIIPLNSCCCIGIPVGIWALVTLMNADVKAAFALNASGRGPSRDQDEGWGESGR